MGGRSRAPRTGRLAPGIGVQLAAGAGALALALVSQSEDVNGVAIFSAGSRDKQHLMLSRLGLRPVSWIEPLPSTEYDDVIRVMYCTSTQELQLRFQRMMDAMAKTIGLDQMLTTSGLASGGSPSGTRKDMRSVPRSIQLPASIAALDSELQLHPELIRDGRRREDGIELGEIVAAEILALRARRRFECHSFCLRTYLTAGKLSADTSETCASRFSRMVLRNSPLQSPLPNSPCSPARTPRLDQS